MHFVTIKKKIKKPQKLIILQFWRSKVQKGPSGLEVLEENPFSYLLQLLKAV